MSLQLKRKIKESSAYAAALKALDLIALPVMQLFSWLSSLLPYRVFRFLMLLLVRFAFWLKPVFRATAQENLKIAFPNESQEFRDSIYRGHLWQLANLLTDCIVLPHRSDQWLREHAEVADNHIIKEALANSPAGVILVTGHYGSFELMGHVAALEFGRFSAIARAFAQPRLDRWWNDIRAARGGEVIDRDGAFPNLVSALERNRAVAVLFDQNVRPRHAVFIPVFGKLAATTRAIGLAAIKTRSPVFIAVGKTLDVEQYRMEFRKVETDDVRNSKELSMHDKVRIITERAEVEFEKFIYECPDHWFWAHRRFRSRPALENDN